MHITDTPWIFTDMPYWIYDPIAGRLAFPEMQSLHDSAAIVQYLRASDLKTHWLNERGKNIGPYLFRDENRWDILEKLLQQEDTHIDISTMAAAECARFDPQRTWDIFERYISTAESVLNYKIYMFKDDHFQGQNDIPTSILVFHPGVQALMATSKNPTSPENIDNLSSWIAHVMSFDDLRHVHLLQTTKEIFATYNQEHVFDELLAERTNMLVQQDVWGLQWLLYGDGLFDDFPNADEIKKTLYDRPPTIPWHIPNIERLTQSPSQRKTNINNRKTKGYYQFEYPGFQTYIDRWAQYLQQQEPCNVHALLFKRPSILAKYITSILWSKLQSQFDGKYRPQLCLFESIPAIINTSKEQRKEFFQNATYLTTNLAKREDYSINLSISTLSSQGHILTTSRWKEVATEVWNHPLGYKSSRALLPRSTDPDEQNRRWIEDLQSQYPQNPDKQLAKYLLIRMLDNTNVDETLFHSWFDIITLQKDLGVKVNLFDTWSQISQHHKSAEPLDVPDIG